MGRAVAVDEEGLKMLLSTALTLQTQVEVLAYLVKKMVGAVGGEGGG